MGEWKRVFHARRVAAMALIVVLSVLFFFAGRMDSYGQGSIQALIDGEQYYGELVQRTRGLSPEEIDACLSEESLLLMQYNSIYGYGYDSEPFVENWEEKVASHPLLAKLNGLPADRVRMVIGAASARVTELMEENEYIAGYPDYIEKIQQQAEMQSQTSLFSDENSFSHRNLVNTAAEFLILQGVPVEYGSNRAYEAWIGFEMADYLYLILIILFVFAFLEERKAGLWGVIRGCPGGRLRLGLHRVAILAVASVLGVALIYGVNLAVSLTLTGGWSDIGRSAQSLQALKTLTIRCTIGEWIVRYLLLKAVSGLLVGLLLWWLLGSINIQYAFAVLCVVLGAEYALFAFLPVQSILNPLKYCNLFSYIRCAKLYTDYLNINLLGYPVGNRRLCLVLLPILLVLFLAGVVLIQAKRRPEGNRSILPAVANRWNRLADVLRRKFSIGGWEFYKTLVFQRVLIILLVVVFLTSSLSYFRINLPPAKSGWELWYQRILEDMRGPLNYDVPGYLAGAREYGQDKEEMLYALDKVEEHVADLQERAAKGGYQAWVVKEIMPYDAAFGDTSRDYQRLNASIGVVFVLLCCAGLCAFEHQSGVVSMVRSLKRGRRGIFARKLFCILAIAGTVWACIYLREFLLFRKHFSPQDIASPIGNFEELQYFPIPALSIGTVMSLLYAIRFVELFCFGAVVMFVSNHMPTVEASYLANFVLFGLPSLLYALGIDVLGFVTPVNAVTSAEAIWNLSATGKFSALFPTALWLALGISACVLTYRQWVGTRWRGKRAAGK